MVMRNRLIGALFLLLLLAFASACKKNSPASGDDAAIRSALQTYLASRTGLNLSAMDMSVKQINANGDTATAVVEFRAKQTGATMDMTYSLQRQSGTWTVKGSQNTGGMSHPPTDQGTMPPAPGALPPGHPPVSSKKTPPN